MSKDKLELQSQKSYAWRSDAELYSRWAQLVPRHPGAQRHSPVTGSHSALLRQLQRRTQFSPYIPGGQAISIKKKQKESGFETHIRHSRQENIRPEPRRNFVTCVLMILMQSENNYTTTTTLSSSTCRDIDLDAHSTTTQISPCAPRGRGAYLGHKSVQSTPPCTCSDHRRGCRMRCSRTYSAWGTAARTCLQGTLWTQAKRR